MSESDEALAEQAEQKPARKWHRFSAENQPAYNPGRPKGTTKARLALRRMLHLLPEFDNANAAGMAWHLLAESAAAGDPRAGKLLLEYALGKPPEAKSHPGVKLGPIRTPADARRAQGRIRRAFDRGEITPAECRELLDVVDRMLATMVSAEQVARLQELVEERGA